MQSSWLKESSFILYEPAGRVSGSNLCDAEWNLKPTPSNTSVIYSCVYNP